MNKRRSQKALENTIAGFIYEFVALVCGLILPRLILSRFGSAYNGITSSITQFISCIALMKSGIGGVTRVALYKPLAENDSQKISEIVVQTERFMRKIAMLFIGFAFVFAIIYSLCIDDFPWLFTASLVLIIAASSFIQYYFGLTYQMVLTADQRQCIVAIVNSVTTILNTVLAVILIYTGFGIHAVKLGSTIVFALNPLIISLYVKRKYCIDKNVEPGTDLIKQRWDAVGHEVANFVNTNTAIIVLTGFSDLLSVSVYAVYNHVIKGIRTVVTTFITGFGAAFGNMYAKKEIEAMHTNLKIYELIIFSLTTVIYATTVVMMIPFVMIYTNGVNDTNYIRPIFSLIITLAGAFSCYRIPYQTIVTVVGHYKQTRNGAFFEAILNIVVSVIGVIQWGLIGVAIGSLTATIFRTCQYGWYLSKNVLPRKIWLFIKHICISLFIIVFVYLLAGLVMPKSFTVFSWIICALGAFVFSFILTVLCNFLFYKNDMKRLLRKLFSFLGKKGKVHK